VQAIGGVNEKIEGFYDVCQARGLTGTQGVIIPASNAGDLMLRHDVLEACIAGQFNIHAVGNIREAMEILMGRPAGVLLDGAYPADSILGIAMQKAGELQGRAQ
jgi:predicted ATP-dependent protease